MHCVEMGYENIVRTFGHFWKEFMNHTAVMDLAGSATNISN